MTDTNEDLVLDSDGIPILTNLIPEDATPYSAETEQEFPYNKLSIEELTGLMLGSETFTQQLDGIAAELVRSVREEIELALKPVIEEAISQALDDSGTPYFEAVRKQLRVTLPELLARTLQD